MTSEVWKSIHIWKLVWMLGDTWIVPGACGGKPLVKVLEKPYIGVVESPSAVYTAVSDMKPTQYTTPWVRNDGLVKVPTFCPATQPVTAGAALRNAPGAVGLEPTP